MVRADRLWSREGIGGLSQRERKRVGLKEVQPQHSAKRTKEGTLASLMWLEDAHTLADAPEEHSLSRSLVSVSVKRLCVFS